MKLSDSPLEQLQDEKVQKALDSYREKYSEENVPRHRSQSLWDTKYKEKHNSKIKFLFFIL